LDISPNLNITAKLIISLDLIACQQYKSLQLVPIYQIIAEKIICQTYCIKKRALFRAALPHLTLFLTYLICYSARCFTG